MAQKSRDDLEASESLIDFSRLTPLQLEAFKFSPQNTCIVNYTWTDIITIDSATNCTLSVAIVRKASASVWGTIRSSSNRVARKLYSRHLAIATTTRRLQLRLRHLLRHLALAHTPLRKHHILPSHKALHIHPRHKTIQRLHQHSLEAHTNQVAQ